MNPAVCGASAFLRSRGPAAVPFRLCCALAILHGVAAAPNCHAVPVDPDAVLLWPEPDTDVPTISGPAR
jgi:hypothetical protein